MPADSIFSSAALMASEACRTEYVPNLAPAATAAFGQGAAAPAITGLPMFADFCNGSIQSQECKYHAGLDLADIVHKTYDVTVATVVVNVTQFPSKTVSNSATITKDASSISAEYGTFGAGAIPVEEVQPIVFGAPHAIPARSATTSAPAAAAKLIGVDVVATQICNDGRSKAVTCLLRPQETASPALVPIASGEINSNLVGSRGTLDNLNIRGLQSAIQKLASPLSACSGWAFGTLSPTAVINSLTATVTNTINLTGASVTAAPGPGAVGPANGAGSANSALSQSTLKSSERSSFTIVAGTMPTLPSQESYPSGDGSDFVLGIDDPEAFLYGTGHPPGTTPTMIPEVAHSELSATGLDSAMFTNPVTLDNLIDEAAGPHGGDAGSMMICNLSNNMCGALTQNLAPATANLPLPSGNTAVTYIPGAGVISIGNTAVTMNGPAATVGGAIVSLNPSGIVINSASTVPVPMQTPAPDTPIVIGGQTYIHHPPQSTINLGGQTLASQGPPVTLNGAIATWGSNGVIITGSAFIPVQTAAAYSGAPLATMFGYSEVFTLNGQVYSYHPGDRTIVLGSVTASIGGPPIMINGRILTVAEGGIYALTPSGMPANAMVYTIGGKTYIYRGDKTLDLGSTTITVGGAAATAGGEHVSLASIGVVIGTNTMPFPTPTISRSRLGPGLAAPTGPTALAVSGARSSKMNASQGVAIGVLAGLFALLHII